MHAIETHILKSVTYYRPDGREMTCYTTHLQSPDITPGHGRVQRDGHGIGLRGVLRTGVVATREEEKRKR